MSASVLRLLDRECRLAARARDVVESGVPETNHLRPSLGPWFYRRADRHGDGRVPKQPRPIWQYAARACDGDRDNGSTGVDGGAEGAQSEGRSQVRTKVPRQDHQPFAVAEPPFDLICPGQRSLRPASQS
jgi:hypothetical protein